MADYEDQNSSEYKDINQETQAADQNPQNGQADPPQNNGQDPYWQNPQNGQADSASESWTESILAESAEQRTVPTAERAAAVLAESVQ